MNYLNEHDCRLVIVTICYNNLEDLIATCASIDRQIRLPDEHWIINGSTTPDIAAWFEQAPQQAFRRIINEPDRGISDAFNKGIAKAGMGMIQLLNAGDVLFDAQVLQRVRDFMECTPQAQWISGKVVTTDSQGEWVEKGVAFDPKRLNRGMDWVAHPTWWVHKSAYHQAGPYDLGLQIAMDYDMMIRLRDLPYAHYPFVSVHFDHQGISNRRFSEGLWEAYRIHRRHLGHSMLLFLTQLRHIWIRKAAQHAWAGKWLRKFRALKARLIALNV
jgi:glycosyltransferase involved in cell wall biosynthesis